MRLLTLLTLCLPLTATIVPMPQLAERVETADVIVVAKLTRGTSFVSGDRLSSDFVLRVDRVLKGKLVPGAEVPATLEGRVLFRNGGAKSDSIPPFYGIWFLNVTSHGYAVSPRLQFAKDYVGEPLLAPVVIPEGAPGGQSGSSPEASVANEIVSAMHSVPAGKSSNELLGLAENFRSLSPTTTLPLYRQLATDPSIHLRAVGIQGLIAANDPQGVILAAADWTQLTAAYPQIDMPLMSYTNEDPAGVRALSTPTLRERAAYALRAIHTREALPALAALLDSKDEMIQSNALAGFCLFVRNAPTITPQSVPLMSWLQTRQPAPFLNPETERYCHPGGTVYPSGDPAAYVNFWKSWWSAHQVEIEQP
jgi:hypothetical protein